MQTRNGVRKSWGLVAAACAAVGLANTAFGVGSVVISQIWGGTTSATGVAAHPKADYIELFNRTGSPVTMNNWSIMVDTSTGTSWTQHNLPNVTIPAYSWYLIQVSATATAGLDLPTPDTTFSTPSFTELTATSGRAVLRSSQTVIASGACPTADIIDLVTYGTTGTCFEGTARAPAGSATGSGLAVFRGAGGCTDTDQNGADFATGIPGPRNSATPSPGGCTSGACCNDNLGTCTSVLGIANCPSGSTYIGDNTLCASNPCSPTGACCNSCTFACTVTTSVGCTVGGWFTGQVCSPTSICATLVAAPTNDLPCNAIALTLNNATSGQVGSATLSNDGPDSSCQAAGGKGVWYTFTPGAGQSGYYNISTCGSTFDDVLAVFSGDCNTPSGFVEVSCDDDTCVGGATDPVVCGTGSSSTLAAVINFVYLNAETTYFIRVQALSTTSLGGSFPIVVNTASAGACCNNTSGACTTTLSTACTSGTYQGDNTVCNPSPCSQGACCNTITGNCTLTSPTGCTAGTYQGNNILCTSNPCPPQADVGIALNLALPTSCIGIGTPVQTSYTITNASGPVDATNVVATFVIPPCFGFTSSTPSGSFANSVLTVNLGTIVVGGSVDVTLNGTAAGGTCGINGVVTRDQPDPGTANNSTTVQSLIVTPGATSNVQLLLSDVPGAASSVLPASGSFSGGNIAVSAESFTRPFFSPDGSRYIVSVDTDLATTSDRVLISGTTNPFTAVVVAQEGVTMFNANEFAGEFDYGMGINNNGDYVFSTTTTGAGSTTGTNDIIVRGNGTTHTVVIREGDAATALGGGVTYSGANTAYAIRANGDIAFLATLAGTSGTSDDTAVFDHNGTTLIGQEGVTIPTGGQDTYQSFVTPGSGNVGEGMTVFGTNGYTLAADLNGATTSDDVLVVDGAVVLAEGQTLPGIADPISIIAYNNHSNNGDWISYGTTAAPGAIDWAVRNGTVVTKTDALARASGTERWDDAIYSQTYFGYVANGVGGYVVAGTFAYNGVVSPASNAELVANGSSLLVREGDPIDLDGNGLLDDDTYISTFRDDRMFLANDGYLYFNSRLKTAANACSGSTADNFQAFMRVPTSANGRCCIGARCAIVSAASCTASGTAGVVFTPGAATCNNAGVLNSPCCFADYNKVGGVGVQDIFDFLAGWFSNSVNANVSGDGVAAPSVQDIFDFLAAWFGGGC